jgi:hypothetical protein
VERGGEGGDTDDGVSAALACRPIELPDVETARETDAAADAVRTLSHWMPMKRQRILLFDKDVERPVVRVPRMLQFHFPVWFGYF